MSVTDPMITDLKGCALRLLDASKPVTDDCEVVQLFCESLERILERGLLRQINSFNSWKDPEPWQWLENLSHNKYGGPYLYQLSVEKTQKCEKVQTNVGRTRLLIRHCLNNRCLHVPFQLLGVSQQYKRLYGCKSVLGNDILSQILMSVVEFPSRLQFKLDTDNARFLDTCWRLPTTRRLTLVPAEQLGISLSFIDGKAIAVEVVPDSVASEDDQIEVGDVIDELNSVVITASMQGCLGQIMRKSAGQPITVYVIKARQDASLYSPLVPLLRRAGLNISQLLQDPLETKEIKVETMSYMGYVLTADRGDVREIKVAINQLLGRSGETVEVTVDCHEMGVTVTQVSNSSVLLKHPYMQISSCGCTVQVPNYFAYIVDWPWKSVTTLQNGMLYAGNNLDRSIKPDNRFICHVFRSESQELIDNTLCSIGQGFKRTRFAV